MKRALYFIPNFKGFCVITMIIILVSCHQEETGEFKEYPGDSINAPVIISGPDSLVPPQVNKIVQNEASSPTGEVSARMEIIDELVRKINTDTKIKWTAFFIKPDSKDSLRIYETYRYGILKNNFVKIEYTNDTVTSDGKYKMVYTEIFYVNKGKLIFAEERETFPKNWPQWNVAFYFHNNKMIWTYSNGHGKTEVDGWDPEKEALTKFELRKQTIFVQGQQMKLTR